LPLVKSVALLKELFDHCTLERLAPVKLHKLDLGEHPLEVGWRAGFLFPKSAAPWRPSFSAIPMILQP